MKTTALKDLIRECSAYITEKTQEIYNLIPGSGNPDGKIMIITNCPSAKEETTGIHFEGTAGKNFTGFLSNFDLGRDDVYTTYIVKYRPYKISEKSGRIVNREVTAEEVRMFNPFLMEEIEVVAPKIIITMGDLAYSAIHEVDREEVPDYGKIQPTKINGKVYEVMAMPHPSEGTFSKVSLDERVLQSLKVLKPSSTNKIMDDNPVFEALQTSEVPSEPPPIVYDAVERPVPKRTKQKLSGKHKVMLIYGGSELSNDPSYVVAERVSSVLAELNVGIKRIDLYRNDLDIEMFFEELKDADGVILATTVEWYGIGGLMQTFLDKAYSSGRLGAFEGTYLLSIVISRQRFEREGLNHLIRSWEILGGIEGVNLCASIASSADIETSSDLLFAIDKKAEDFYRVINQQRMPLPTSITNNKVVIKMTARPETPTKLGELSKASAALEKTVSDKSASKQPSISNYDEFIEKQQKDIENIASLFKERLSSADALARSFREMFELRYKPDKDFEDCSISWVINDSAADSFVMIFKGGSLKTRNGKMNDADVIISSNREVVANITVKKLTIQRAFMTGEIKAKGNFTLLYRLDGLFAFK